MTESTTTQPDAGTSATDPGPADEKDTSLGDASRALVLKFDAVVDALRPELFRYCRYLTRSVWDAEDLSQETLMRAFGALAGASTAFEERPRAYLFRIATNAWIDAMRRRAKHDVVALPDDIPAADAPELPSATHEALTRLAHRLPPRERVAVLLRDVFEYSLAEIANIQACTSGAVKAALHRGRAALAERREERMQQDEEQAGAPARELVDTWVEAFNARDIDRLIGLIVPGARLQIGTAVTGHSQDLAQLVLRHTMDDKTLRRAEAALIDGQRVAVLWYEAAESGGRERISDVVRLDQSEGAINGLKFAYFSPEVLNAVGAKLGAPVRTQGYHYAPPSAKK